MYPCWDVIICIELNTLKIRIVGRIDATLNIRRVSVTFHSWCYWIVVQRIVDEFFVLWQRDLSPLDHVGTLSDSTARSKHLESGQVGSFATWPRLHYWWPLNFFNYFAGKEGWKVVRWKPDQPDRFLRPCIVLITWVRVCDMVKYFKSRLIYFQEPKASENKAWEWNI